MDKTYNTVDDFISGAGITGKNALRIRLLSEEVERFADSVIGEGERSIRIEGDERVASIILESPNRIDIDRQKKILSVSSSGENISTRGFFGKLQSLIMPDNYEESEWSLKDYEDEIRRRRKEDIYSQEAWEDLERSLIASLSDDIEVGISRSKIKMIVTKDFSESLGEAATRNPRITTGCAFINTINPDEKRFLDDADRLIGEMGVSPKDATHLKLLLEEVAGMLKELTSDFQAMFWFEKYKDECCLKVTGKTNMDIVKKKDLLNISSSGKNTAAKGIMGKIGDVIENGLLNYEEVSRLSQMYGGACVDYGSMGIYGGSPDSMNTAVMWSLRDYRDALNDIPKEGDASLAWDELERSIVASLAADVLVSIKGDRIDMTVVYRLKG
ncbi:MAG: hypothetical protein K6E49_08030 [Lachnospiraceae bacterium]|nr:hypothetical protein [Lachnospiraceae bacterium]